MKTSLIVALCFGVALAINPLYKREAGSGDQGGQEGMGDMNEFREEDFVKTTMLDVAPEEVRPYLRELVRKIPKEHVDFLLSPVKPEDIDFLHGTLSSVGEFVVNVANAFANHIKESGPEDSWEKFAADMESFAEHECFENEVHCEQAKQLSMGMLVKALISGTQLRPEGEKGDEPACIKVGEFSGSALPCVMVKTKAMGQIIEFASFMLREVFLYTPRSEENPFGLQWCDAVMRWIDGVYMGQEARPSDLRRALVNNTQCFLGNLAAIHSLQMFIRENIPMPPVGRLITLNVFGGIYEEQMWNIGSDFFQLHMLHENMKSREEGYEKEMSGDGSGDAPPPPMDQTAEGKFAKRSVAKLTQAHFFRM
jgi:hypothetical protein